jgi:hypothetical protein
MNMWNTKIVLFVGVIALAGCASYRRRLEVSTIEKIRVHETTRAEVEASLGRPRETVTGANGITVARYFFHEFRRSTDVSWHERRDHPGDILFRTLTLRFGASNVVEQKLHDESVTPVFRTNAWFFAGPALTPESVAFIKRAFTHERDVLAKFGEPTSRTFDGEGRSVLAWFSVKAEQMRWGNPSVQRLMVFFNERRMVLDYVLVEHALSEFEPLTLQ